MWHIWLELGHACFGWFAAFSWSNFTSCKSMPQENLSYPGFGVHATLSKNFVARSNIHAYLFKNFRCLFERLWKALVCRSLSIHFCPFGRISISVHFPMDGHKLVLATAVSWTLAISINFLLPLCVWERGSTSLWKELNAQLTVYGAHGNFFSSLYPLVRKNQFWFNSYLQLLQCLWKSAILCLWLGYF